MTIAAPGTNTSIELDWTTAKVPDGRVRHFAVRAPWTFCVTEYPTGAKSRNTELVAHHPDGRGGTTLHAGADYAKAYALTRLHPSEAMAWHSHELVPGGSVHTASWGTLYFAAVTTDDGQLRFGYRVDGDLSDEVLTLPGMHDVQQWATGVLIEHYGPVRPVVDVPLPEVADSPAERLSAAFGDALDRIVTEGEIEVALAHAELWLRPAVPRSQRAPLLSPEERLSRALAASFWVKRSAGEVAELLRRAGLSLS